MMGKSKQVGKL